jgi:hypothetical protein
MTHLMRSGAVVHIYSERAHAPVFIILAERLGDSWALQPSANWFRNLRKYSCTFFCKIYFFLF